MALLQPAQRLAEALEAAEDDRFIDQFTLLCNTGVFSGRGYAACLISNEFGSKAALRCP